MKKVWPYLSYLRNYRKHLLWGILFGAIYGVTSGFGVPYFLQKVYHDIFESAERYVLMEVVLVALALPAVMGVRGLAGYANQYLLNYCGQQVLRQVRLELFRKFADLPLSFHNARLSGDLLSRASADTLIMQDVILSLANELVRLPLVLLGSLGYIAYLTWAYDEVSFLLILLVIAPLVILPVRLISRHLKKRGRQVQESLGDITQQMNESLEGALEIRSFVREKALSNKFSDRLASYLLYQMKVTKYEKITQPLMELIGAGVIAGSFVYAWNAGLPFAIFLGLGSALYFFFDSLKRLLRLTNHASKAQGAFERVEDILQQEITIRSPEKPAQVKGIDGHITMRKVSFAYDKMDVLRDVSVEMPRGEVIALVGPSGAGKSTLASLLPRFYDVTGGEITIDGTDIRSLSLETLRHSIGIVPQRPVLFDGTVAENILMGKPDASMEEVEQAARAAHAHNFIERLEDGYCTQVGENGTRLSGGQRQRIALARAFLKNAPILILDEATSALDSDSEAKIQQALEVLVKGKTTLIIAHRFSTIRLASRILVIESGQLTASGSHDELIEKSETYKRLYEQQTG